MGEPELDRVSLNGKTYALPFKKLFRAHTPIERQELTDSIRDIWIQIPVVTYISPAHGRSILDGIGRTEVANEVDSDREIPVCDCGEMSDSSAEALAYHLNKRRHLSAEDFKKAREEEKAKVRELNATGISGRAIAERLKMHPTQVRRDLAGVSTVCAPDVNEEEYEECDEEQPTNRIGPVNRVQGKDGKFYPASRAPVIVAKVPPNLDRDAALIELGKARKCAATLTGILDELMRGPLKKDVRKAALAWDKFAAELEAVEAA